MNLHAKLPAVVQILKGCATLVPGVNAMAQRTRSMRVPAELHQARYYYEIWLRHLMKAAENGLPSNPRVVTELGPGMSLGAGLAALLSGTERYYAADTVRHASVQGNLALFDELVDLFRRRADLRGGDSSNTEPKGGAYHYPLASYSFPHHILNTERLDHALDPTRIADLRRSVVLAGSHDSDSSSIRYLVPWQSSEALETASVDMVFSHAVLEHVDDLHHAYEEMHRWLKVGGFMSHQIDYRCHDMAAHWNGHWIYSDLTWRLMRGRRPYLINRVQHSRHVDLIRQSGFEIVSEQKAIFRSEIEPRHFAPRFRGDAADCTTAGTFIQALKPAS